MRSSRRIRAKAPAKIGRVIDQYVTMLRAEERSSRAFASAPLAPALPQNRFLGLGGRPIGRIGFGQRQLERSLGITLEPRMRDELT